MKQQHILQVGAGGILAKYLEAYLPQITRNTIELEVMSLEQHKPSILPSYVPYCSSAEFWATMLQRPKKCFGFYGGPFYFDKAVVAVQGQYIAEVAKQLLEHDVAHQIHLEKPAATSQEAQDLLISLDRRHPHRLWYISHYRRKPSFRKVFRIIQSGSIGDVKEIEITILEGKIINPYEVTAHEAGILRCFTPHAEFALSALADANLQPEFACGGCYEGSLLPQGLETCVMVVGKTGPRQCPEHEINYFNRPAKVTYRLGKGLWDEKYAIVEGTDGLIIADYSHHSLVLRSKTRGTRIHQISEQDDSYQTIIEDIIGLRPLRNNVTQRGWNAIFNAINATHEMLVNVTIKCGLFSYQPGERFDWYRKYRSFRKGFNLQNKIL